MMDTPKPGTILHVVAAECGCYSDHTVWTVAAYVDRAAAEAHAKLAREWHSAKFERLDAISGRDAYGPKWSKVNDEVNPHDPAPYQQRDTEWSVSVLFVHHDPAQFAAESAVLMDRAREAGWIP
jgi:hypothetical protein